MKKLVTMVVGAMAAVAAFGAAQNDLRVTFWSAGPDQYKDGSTVVDGEMYALVWTKAGSTFAGFAADGSLVDAAASQLSWPGRGRRAASASRSSISSTRRRRRRIRRVPSRSSASTRATPTVR